MDGPALPRSIRWRLQLGVWMLPSSQKEQHQQHWQDGDAHDTESEWTLTEILERNQDLIDVQRGNYDLLVQMLQEVMEQNDEQEQEHEQVREQNDSDEEHPSKATTASLNTKLPTPVDPLTALVKERDAQEQRLYDLDLKYRKRRARRKRGLLTTETDRGDTYSSSLTLGVIEKDLVRLPPEHHTYHHSRKNFGHQGRRPLSDIGYGTIYSTHRNASNLRSPKPPYWISPRNA
ncbi:hypothetical protein MHU86_12524 [Fragilaria crotonensis]|nr:hypothetical protein MHU86_12524 [Fragilaria crotonensis]